MEPESSHGRIEVITGSMFSGKTEELLKRLEKAELSGKTVKVFKPAVDDRYSEDSVSSHNGVEMDAKIVETDEVDQSIFCPDTDVVGVDEANFFDEALVERCQELANNGKRVIVAGTDQTFRGEPFQPVPKLCAVAEYVEKLRAVCEQCGKPATRNQRIIDGEPAHEDDPTVLVGADEKYEPRCRKCHILRTD